MPLAVGGVREPGDVADDLSPLFVAAMDATEEAIYNSLFKAATTTGNGRTVEALPLDRVLEPYQAVKDSRGVRTADRRRQEWRRGTHECMRHVESGYGAENAIAASTPRRSAFASARAMASARSSYSNAGAT